MRRRRGRVLKSASRAHAHASWDPRPAQYKSSSRMQMRCPNSRGRGMSADRVLHRSLEVDVGVRCELPWPDHARRALVMAVVTADGTEQGPDSDVGGAEADRSCSGVRAACRHRHATLAREWAPGVRTYVRACCPNPRTEAGMRAYERRRRQRAAEEPGPYGSKLPDVLRPMSERRRVRVSRSERIVPSCVEWLN